MEAAKQALIDEFAAAEESIGAVILEARKKIRRKLSDAFEPELGGKKAAILSELGRVAALSHDVRLILFDASAIVDAPSLEEMMRRNKKRIPVEFTAIQDEDKIFCGVEMRAIRGAWPRMSLKFVTWQITQILDAADRAVARNGGPLSWDRQHGEQSCRR